VENGRVLLNAGRAHGLVAGMQLLAHPAGTTDFTKEEKTRPIIEVLTTAAVSSEAEIVSAGSPEVAPGAQAVPIPVTLPSLRRVGVLAEAGAPNDRMQLVPARLAGDAALIGFADEIGRALSAEGDRLVTVASDRADFNVVRRAGGALDLCDGSGDALPHLRPQLRLATPNVAQRVAQRLSHLARYQNIRALLNDDRALANALQVELFAAPDDYRGGAVIIGDRPALGGDVQLREGAWVFLRLRNQSAHVLNVTVLDLQPGWGISRLFPDNAPYRALDPDGKEELGVRFYLPEGYDEGVDILKIFATVETTDFDWLQLPALDQPARPAPATRSARGLTGQLMAAVAAEPPGTRNAALSANSSSSLWSARNIEVRIERAKGNH
jgi:hypothetical protein